MTAIEPHIEKFQHIDPQQVESYLLAHGWQQQQRRGDKASVWTLDGFEILLPLKPEIIDFKRRMAEVVETLALAEKRSQVEIYGALITEARELPRPYPVIRIRSRLLAYFSIFPELPLRYLLLQIYL